jgi:hypothetical protein
VAAVQPISGGMAPGSAPTRSAVAVEDVRRGDDQDRADQREDDGARRHAVRREPQAAGGGEDDQRGDAGLGELQEV